MHKKRQTKNLYAATFPESTNLTIDEVMIKFLKNNKEKIKKEIRKLEDASIDGRIIREFIRKKNLAQKTTERTEKIVKVEVEMTEKQKKQKLKQEKKKKKKKEKKKKKKKEDKTKK